MDGSATMTTTAKPEIGRSVVAEWIATNYLEDGSGDDKVLLIHGSGPGVIRFCSSQRVAAAKNEPALTAT